MMISFFTGWLCAQPDAEMGMLRRKKRRDRKGVIKGE